MRIGERYLYDHFDCKIICELTKILSIDRAETIIVKSYDSFWKSGDKTIHYTIANLNWKRLHNQDAL